MHTQSRCLVLLPWAQAFQSQKLGLRKVSGHGRGRMDPETQSCVVSTSETNPDFRQEDGSSAGSAEPDLTWCL